MQATLLHASNNILAEGPLWHRTRQSLFWVDIDGYCFYEYSWPQGTVSRWSLDYRVSVLAETSNRDELIMGLQGGIARYNLVSKQLTWLQELEQDIPTNRTNDGGCDAAGRLWVGTMDRHCATGKGSLYVYSASGGLHKKVTGVSVSNGIVWSADSKTMYYTDSPTRQVQCFNFDVETGVAKFEKIAISIDESLGSPDGMCMDEEGMLWIAQWGGFGVYRWNPLTGELLGKIDVPVPQVSSCAFGGNNLDQLFITTARENMSDEDVEKYPLSGNIFVAQPGVKGSPVHMYGDNHRSNI